MKTPRSVAQQEAEKNSLIDSRWAYRGRIVNLRLDTYQLGPKTKIAEIIHHPGAVVILPIAPDGKLLLVQQWRRAAGEILIELPAGTLEENEDPKLCALRELQEETGYLSEKLTPLGGFFAAPGYADEYLHLFLAEQLRPSPLPPDDDEAIDLLPLSLKDALHLIETGRIRDAKTIAGILRYNLRHPS